MLNLLTVVLFIAVLAGAIAIQVEQPCPSNVSTQPDFNITLYAGKWFVIERFDSLHEDVCSNVQYCATLSCEITTDVHDNIDDDENYITLATVGTVNTTTYIDFFYPSWTYNNTVAELTSDFFYDGHIAQYQILETDYQNYSVVLICENLENSTSSQQNAQILSRQRSLTPEVLNQTHLVLEQNAINQTLLVQVNQTNCDS